MGLRDMDDLRGWTPPPFPNFDRYVSDVGKWPSGQDDRDPDDTEPVERWPRRKP